MKTYQQPLQALPCPKCQKVDDLGVFRYDNGIVHVECDRCLYLGPGESTARKAVLAHNAAMLGEAVK